MKSSSKEKLVPLVMTAVVLALDQASKLVVTLTLIENRPVAVLGDFFRLTLVRNPFVVFSPGSGLPPFFQTVVFIVLPVIALGLLVFFYFREKDLRRAYRAPLAAILGGGLGNLSDRIVRPGGVVDFLDFKFFGIFGLTRRSAFNLSDAAIAVGVVSIFGIWIIQVIRKLRENKVKKNL